MNESNKFHPYSSIHGSYIVNLPAEWNRYLETPIEVLHYFLGQDLEDFSFIYVVKWGFTMSVM